MALIVGQPGCGKTEAIRAFKNATPGAIIYNVTAGEGGAFCAAQELMRVLEMGQPNARKLADERRRIGEKIGAGNMLLIDEAQYVVQHNTRGADSWLALEWFRSMANECFINVALIGDLFLLGMELALPQLWGRVATNRPVIRRETSKADVAMLAASFSIHDATSLQVLRSLSKRGGLRQVAIRARINAGFGLWQLAYGSKQTLTAANYAAARAAMQTFTSDGGRKLGVNPNVLVVPPALEEAALNLLNTEYGAGGASNPWKGTAQLIVTPYL